MILFLSLDILFEQITIFYLFSWMLMDIASRYRIRYTLHIYKFSGEHTYALLDTQLTNLVKKTSDKDLENKNKLQMVLEGEC